MAAGEAQKRRALTALSKNPSLVPGTDNHVAPVPGNLMASYDFYRLLHTCNTHILTWVHTQTHKLKTKKRENKQASWIASQKLMDLKVTCLPPAKPEGYTSILMKPALHSLRHLPGQ